MSFRFALLMMEAIALWHRMEMSYSFDVSVRCMTFLARDEVGVLSGCEHGSEGVGDMGCLCCGVVCSCQFAELRRFVRRLSCLLSPLVRGVCILLGSVWVYSCAIGQMVWTSSWYALSIVMTSFAAALSM